MSVHCQEKQQQQQQRKQQHHDHLDHDPSSPPATGRGSTGSTEPRDSQLGSELNQVCGDISYFQEILQFIQFSGPVVLSDSTI